MTNYAKERYDIRIRMYPEDFNALWGVLSLVDSLPLNNDYRRMIKRFKYLNGKIHNKMVEINRR